MRVALVTESFPPQINGVARSVARAAAHLASRGIEPVVVAPAPGPGPRPVFDWPVVHVPSVRLPAYRHFRAGLATKALDDALDAHRPDVVHLASPFGYTARAAAWAERRGVPAVAVWQTDLPAYTRAYHLTAFEQLVWQRLKSIHSRAAVNLALSECTARSLTAQGIGGVAVLPHGVDTNRFHPAFRDTALHDALAPDGELLVGYVGRLAREKQLHWLADTAALPGVRLVIAGDGPRRKALERLLPQAQFLGALHGTDLSRLYASLDLFVHTGPFETFGQTIQEAHASGVPVLAVDAGGAPELVDPGVDGTHFPAGDTAALAGLVASLAGQRDVLRQWGRRGRLKVRGRTWEAEGDALIEHYGRALALGPARGGLRPPVPTA
ncbi:glycosyltransferase [Glycomyces artemisiae]|uniref:Phosphatidylinositol alpha 1,6-mannosyltransferase n=1 Tax=Glycomyces artemisiae TaxID=1076443 RepID=A0A2T0UG43_9ACTN|nr:glycosyltransferase [Glycomyces artemisiae]PRY56915.1 phosphatidylinositol alpha 1,6-mannosyltransferase [Glycomyces artemisiae]